MVAVTQGVPVLTGVGVEVYPPKLVGVDVGERVIVGVLVRVGVRVIVDVSVIVGVRVEVPVQVGVFVLVGVGVMVELFVIVEVGVLVGVLVGDPGVGVLVGVKVEMFVGLLVKVGVFACDEGEAGDMLTPLPQAQGSAANSSKSIRTPKNRFNIINPSTPTTYFIDASPKLMFWSSPSVVGVTGPKLR